MVRQGYKQTAIGVIPEDWDIVAIKTLATDMSDGPFGSNLKKEHYTGEKQARIIQLSNIGENGWLDENVKYTTFSHAKTISRCIVQPGNIIIAKMMPAGRAIICPNTEEMYVLGSDSIKLQLNAALVNTAYFMYSTKSRFFQTQIKEETQGSTRARTSISKLRKNNVFLPPLPEQELIAEALSDIDNMISSLEKLIAKKKAIKQGAMQELLTGKKRLPGFTGEWTVKCIDDIATVLDDHRIPVKESDREKMAGTIPYCGANGIVGYVNDYTIDDEIILIAEDGGYFDEYATRSIAYKMSGKCWVNNHAHILKSKSNTDQNYLFYCLVHKDIRDFISSGTRSKLNKTELLKITIQLPVCLQEQISIASILSDIDNETEALEQKLAKARQVKQGMMQQLLTGKIRLV